MPPLSRRTPGVLSNSGSPTTRSPRSANSSPTKRDQVLPDDLGPVVRAYLDSHPSLAWDEALAEVIDWGMQ